MDKKYDGMYLIKTSQGPRPDWGRIERHIKSRAGYKGIKFDKAAIQALADVLKKDYETIQKLADEWKDEVNP